MDLRDSLRGSEDQADEWEREAEAYGHQLSDNLSRRKDEIEEGVRDKVDRAEHDL